MLREFPTSWTRAQSRAGELRLGHAHAGRPPSSDTTHSMPSPTVSRLRSTAERRAGPGTRPPPRARAADAYAKCGRLTNPVPWATVARVFSSAACRSRLERVEQALGLAAGQPPGRWALRVPLPPAGWGAAGARRPRAAVGPPSPRPPPPHRRRRPAFGGGGRRFSSRGGASAGSLVVEARVGVVGLALECAAIGIRRLAPLLGAEQRVAASVRRRPGRASGSRSRPAAAARASAASLPGKSRRR